jgi:hypothetical protein
MRLEIRRNAMYVATLVVIGGSVIASTVGAQSLTEAPPPAANPAPLVAEEDFQPWSTALGAHVLENNTFTGLYNTGLGRYALTANTTGAYNTATGDWALNSNTTGSRNTATGGRTLFLNTTGSDNTAIGMVAMNANTTGNWNTATGEAALGINATGDNNTATGYAALNANQTGSNNTGVGWEAGRDALGSHNIFLGANVYGTAADNNTMRLGTPYDGTNGQTQTFIAGIYGTALPPGSFVPVYINAAGQLGTALASPAVNGGQATGIDLNVLSQQLLDMRARLEATEAANAALHVRLAELEARVGK